MPDERAHTTSTPAPRVRWGAIAAFILLAYGLAWLVVSPLWLSPTAAASPFASLLITAMMFTPGIAALAVLFLLRAPRTRRLEFLGMWPLRPVKRTVWFTVAALIVPALITAVSLGIAAAFGWVRLDLVNFSGFEEQLAATTPEEALAILPSTGVLVAVQLAMIPLGAVLNALPALGEELGWRGWLLPALRPLGTWPALILSGAIWGLWHAPVTLLGHNYGLTDWRGVALMLGACVAWGILFGWSRLRTASIWPAVVGHGALNASGGMILLFAAAGDAPNMALGSVMGVAGWIALAIVVLVLVLTGQFRHQPSLERRTPALSAQPPHRSLPDSSKPSAQLQTSMTDPSEPRTPRPTDR